MESIRNAATAAANLVGLGGNTEETRGKLSYSCWSSEHEAAEEQEKLKP
jgi:hypothetical protein